MVYVQEAAVIAITFLKAGWLWALSPCVFAYFLHMFSCTYSLAEKRLFHQKNTSIDGIESEQGMYGSKQIQPFSTLI